MSEQAGLYACLYAREFPAQAMLRLRPEMRGRAFVVMEGEPPLQVACAMNAQARRIGVARGMTRVETETFAQLAVLPRSAVEEATARAALLECAGSFSPRVEECGESGAFLCVIDIAGTEKLFGPAQALACALGDRVRALGVLPVVSVSHNFHAAICLARSAAARGQSVAIALGDAGATLAKLPLGVLDLAAEHAEVLEWWGIRTLGALAALPERELIARLGQEGKRLRQLARGEWPHLFVPMEPEFRLEERMELDVPVELLESLLFVVGAMVEQLVLRAVGRVLALASVTIELRLEGGAAHARTVRPALPSNDRRLWLKLLHLDLEAHLPAAAIVAVTLSAEPGKTSKVQLGLFSPQLPEPGRLDVTLARIRAIVGDECVGQAVLRDTHRPDSFRMERFTVAALANAQALVSERAAEQAPKAAMRRLRPAERVAVVVQRGRPASVTFRETRYEVEEAYGPWMTCGDWWNAELWDMEQWDVVARAGTREGDAGLLFCCLVRDLRQQCWQVAGLYD